MKTRWTAATLLALASVTMGQDRSVLELAKMASKQAKVASGAVASADPAPVPTTVAMRLTGPVEMRRGETIEVLLTAHSLTGSPEGIGWYEFLIHTDPSVFEFIEVVPSPDTTWMLAQHTPNLDRVNDDVNDGLFEYTMGPAKSKVHEATTAGILVATIKFRVRDNAPAGATTIETVCPYIPTITSACWIPNHGWIGLLMTWASNDDTTAGQPLILTGSGTSRMTPKVEDIEVPPDANPSLDCYLKAYSNCQTGGTP